MVEILSKEEQKEYAEEIEYNQADESRRKELLKEQQEKYERENARRKYQEDADYEEEKRKTITLPTPKSTQQRETLPEEARPSSEDLEYEYASTERKREILAQEQAPAPKKPNKSEKFEKDQDNWNQQQKARYQREEIEAKGKEYEKEQAELFEKNKKKGAFGAFGGKIKEVINKDAEAAKKKKEARDAAKAAKPQIPKEPFGNKARRFSHEVAGKKQTGKQTRGQFHAPGGAGNYSDPFAKMDPFGGFGGGKMKNMMAIDPLVGFGTRPINPQPKQQKMTPQQERMARVRAGKSAPVQQPRMFADPFAGLRIIPTRKPAAQKTPARGGRQKRPGDISTALAKEFGIGSGKKQSKKPKKIDWMNF